MKLHPMVVIVGLAAAMIGGFHLLSSDSRSVKDPTKTEVVVSKEEPVMIPRFEGDKTGPFVKLDGVSLDQKAALTAFNGWRKNSGLKPVVESLELEKAAKAFLEELAKDRAIEQRGMDNASLVARLKAAGFGAKLASQNVGVGQVEFGQAFYMWRQSQITLDRMKNKDITHVAFVMLKDPKSFWKTHWVLVMAQKA